MWGINIHRGRAARRASLIIAIVCVVAIVAASFQGAGYGADLPDRYKISFFQLSVTQDGVTPTDKPVSIEYTALTQWMVYDDDTTKNPGAVAYLGNDGPKKFMGWYEFNAPDDSPFIFGTAVTKNVNLFARFTDGYLVTFLNGFGDPFLTKLVEPGEEVTAPTDGEMSLFTAPDGKHFDTAGGWLINDNGTIVTFDFDTTAVNADITLSPTLTDGNWFVYFVSEGSQVPFQSIPNGEDAKMPETPKRDGYKFDHWSTTEGGIAFDFNTDIEKDRTLYAVWTAQPVNYTVVVWREKKNIAGDAGTDTANYEYVNKFTLQATAGSSMNGPIANAESYVKASAPQPAWSAYGFAASTSENVLGNGTTVLNVYYKRTVYTFSFTPYNSATSGTLNATMKIESSTYTNANRYSFTAKYEQDVSAVWPVRPLAQFTATVSNLNFQGWKATGVSTVFVSRVTTISEDLFPGSGTSQTLTAAWLTSGMDINLHYMFESVDGNIPGAVLYNGKYYVQDDSYSQSVFSSGSPFALKEIKGMKALTSNALQKSGSSYVAVSSTTKLSDQYLFYDRIGYNIAFGSQGGTSVTNLTGILPGTRLAAKKPQDPTRTGSGATYAFDGWYTDADYTSLFDFATETMPDSNLILYAKWKQDPFTVSVYDGLANASLIGTYTRAQNEYVGDPEAALAAAGVSVSYTVGQTYPGKGEFLGWVIPLGPGEKTPLSAELPVTANLSVYADWTPQKYSVTYTSGGATGTPPVDTRTYQRGVSARVLEPTGPAIALPYTSSGSLVPPQDTTFIGWMDREKHMHYPGEMITVTKNTVLTAIYEKVPTVVVYVYHINYPADSVDSSGAAITDPGNLKQYVAPEDDFPIVSYSAYSPTPEPVGYRFGGWVTGSAIGAEGKTVYPGGAEIKSAASADSGDPNDDLHHMWAVWIKNLPVTFDAGDWGTISPGSIGRTQAVYQVPMNSSLGAIGISVPAIQVRDTDYAFMGWANESDSTNEIIDNISDEPVTNAITYTAIYTGTPSQPLVDYYYGVTFDAGGVYGNIAKSDWSDSGESNVVYSVITGSSLSAGAISVPGVNIKSDGYTQIEFGGWALADNWPTTIGNGVILNTPIDGPTIYKAVYHIMPPILADHYYAVIFDSGGVYGKLSDGTTSTAISVEKGKALGDVNGFAVPTVDTINDDFTFVGWSPAVNMEAPVNEVKRYIAQYAYTPQGISDSETYYTVSFDLGSEGKYKTIPMTSYPVKKSTSLGGIMTEDTVPEPVFTNSYFEKDNIDVEKDFKFIGWTVAGNPSNTTISISAISAAPVYADKVYTALYAYEPPEPEYETINIEVEGYDVYYDGNPHRVTYTTPSALTDVEVLKFWFDPSKIGLPLSKSVDVKDGDGIWEEGLPPGETDVSNDVADLIFSANGKYPTEITRAAIIRPRPLVPNATHAAITVGDDIPQRASYGRLTINYDGKQKDGSPIPANNPFDFEAHKSEFPIDEPQIRTTYNQGDPAGVYPIYVKAGTYGNYEIYEGTEGDWPEFDGWRFAGTMQVNAAPVITTPSGVSKTTPTAIKGLGGNKASANKDADESGSVDRAPGDGNESGAAKTGDEANPMLWTILLIASAAILVALLTYKRRKILR
ncbi:MAG: InlB B-repeat-containing protein [Clostridiales Family XIII bacterium]|jgi:uncharacterized repeat protein (TIGR02543 family)|nr:InlB B-repeat-containing protein [Clostridiales Family XIII bacterium]